MVDAPNAEDVFALLNHVLSGARLRVQNEARPIAFDLAPSGETWCFDPKSEGPLFQRKDAVGPMLHVRCAPELLARLVTEPDFELRDEDDAAFEGDLNDLLRLVAAFEETKSALGIRASRTSR